RCTATPSGSTSPPTSSTTSRARSGRCCRLRSDRLQSGMRFSAVGLLVVACASACAVDLEHGLDEPAANEVALALQRAGGSARKEAVGTGDARQFAIRVPAGEVTHAMEILKANELPRARGPAFRDLYAKPSLVPSAGEERARYLDALSGELARTLETADGVV